MGCTTSRPRWLFQFTEDIYDLAQDAATDYPRKYSHMSG